MFKKFIDYILPINLLFDISLAFFEKGGVVPIFRAALMLGLLTFFLVQYSKNNKYYSATILFSAYVLITVIFSEDVFRSLSISLKVIISILSFTIGFNYFNSFLKLKTLNNSIVFVLIIVLLNFFLSTLFGIGVDVYTKESDFLAGNLDDSWNVFTYSLLLSPLILLQYQNQNMNKILLQILIFTNLIILILSIKRISIIGVVIGGLIYSFFNFNLYRNFKALLIVLVVLLATFPLYEKTLLKRFDARADRFQENSLEEEARYMETGFVWNEIFAFKDPIEVLFGLEGFNSVGNYADGKFGERNLHVDYNLIVNTEGVVGLILYFVIFIQIFLLYLKVKNSNSKIPPKLFKPIKGVFFAFLLTQFATSLSGQMYMVTFRMIIFIYLGAILGIMLRYSDESKKEIVNTN
jgi:hypothetical protein